MKKTLIFSFLLVVLFGQSCSNDFDVTAPWRDIPVVYGLVDLNEPVHFIRVEKAFLDPDADATDIAQIADSLYYEPSLIVQFEVDGNVFDLERVDGNGIEFPREEGIFAHEPNWLYKIDQAEIGLEEGDIVSLNIDRGGNLPAVTASTQVQGPGRLRTPDPTLPSGPRLDFSSNIPEEIKWQSSDDASIFDVSVFFNYVEFPASDPNASVEKSLEWIWAQGVRAAITLDNASHVVSKETQEFYEILANNIEVDSDIVRFFTGCTVRIVSGGEDFEKYVTVVQANTGITGSTEPPTFTNLSEGLGVFSSRNIIEVEGILLSNPTMEEIRTNELTAPLNFQ